MKKGIKQRIYKDDRTHSMYRAYIQQRNQANYRKEQWNFEFLEWKDMWDAYWEQKGRGVDQYNMTRLDPDSAWSKDNTAVLPRKEILKLNGSRRAKKNRNV